ncbi:MAG: baseplate J/gp47 family protein [Burkholderiales bacterium]|nr:baseplate J/gp47 family protein [Burkholderiales bacterium]
MQLNTQTLTQIVTNMVTAIQGATTALIDFTAGSVLRAITQAYGSLALWLQSLILQVLSVTRLATSTGADVDSWLADYGFTRLPGTVATGQVVFSRYTPTNQANIAIGTQVQSGDGTLVYTVIVDSTNANYNTTLGYYVIPAGVSSASVTVQAAGVGTTYNAAIAQINTLTTVTPGVDYISNPAAFVNGANAESDVAVKTRFQAWVQSLSRATKAAVNYAIQQAALTLGNSAATWQIYENQTYAGAVALGQFYVVIDDGTGYPSNTFLTAIGNAIDSYRPLSVQWTLYPPTVLLANVQMALTLNAGYDPVATPAAIATYITNQINAGGLGAGLPYSRLAQWAWDAVPGAVANAYGILLNGGTADLAALPKQSIRAGSVVV